MLVDDGQRSAVFPRVRFALDSPLEEAVMSELVSEAGVAADEFLESIKKGSKPSDP